MVIAEFLTLFSSLPWLEYIVWKGCIFFGKGSGKTKKVLTIQKSRQHNGQWVLSQEFFDGAVIDIEIKAKVICESDKDNIINEYIVFCKVFNGQIKEHGMTKQAVTETIRICKDRNILKQYLSSREVEIVTITMSLFDDEQIMKTYTKNIKREALLEKAMLMLKKGKINIDEISEYFPELLESDIKEIEAEVMQLA